MATDPCRWPIPCDPARAWGAPIDRRTVPMCVAHAPMKMAPAEYEEPAEVLHDPM
jgi:hypothetical protein